MSVIEILVIIVAGVLVGFINTLSGGGSVISLSLLLILGLPANIANGTNRISIFFQTLSSVGSFTRQKMFTNLRPVWLSIPATVGSVMGAYLAVDVSEKVVEIAMAVAMVIMLFFLFYKPDKWLKEKPLMLDKPLRWWQFLIFFGVGFYGGFIQVGVGYFLLMALVLGVGYDLVKANAVKNLIVFFYAIFALLVFIVDGKVNYLYGLILSAGSMVGALIASYLAVKKGAGFIRAVIVFSVLLTILQVSGLINFAALYQRLLQVNP
ncbi:MAG TPA: sulfite exporter TauE/SafE family protein [Bacteroidales bacterium]|nr:sulfite exporter TauE/SafE family protein [Bacteroidales bacterium]HPT10086.1 sulfite exporter TauE/SafE family protein [Bacteroidales bacterium]